jgi:hypothetical protein
MKEMDCFHMEMVRVAKKEKSASLYESIYIYHRIETFTQRKCPPHHTQQFICFATVP